MTASTTDEAELALIALDKIEPSPFNPRKTFEEGALAELGKSIAKKGVLQPIVVRPNGKAIAHHADNDLWYVAYPRKSNSTTDTQLNIQQPHSGPTAEADCRKTVNEINRKAGYQIVAGERRWRASALAGLKVIPAVIRHLSDKDAAEVAVIENDQREDVAPLEQAEGYAYLVKLGDDAETIAAKIGRPVKYVVGRLQLTHLIDELKEDLRKGKLPFGHAYLLSKLKEDDQKQFIDRSGYAGNCWLYDYHDNPIHLSDLRRRIKEGFLLCLSAAPWKKDDATLTPAGPCTTCPRRTGQNPTLFDELLNGDAKKGRDFCTDGKCYQEKHDAFIQLQLKKASESAGGATPLKVTTDWYSRDKEVLSKDKYDIVPAKEVKKAKPGELQPAVVVSSERGTTDGVGKIVHIRMKKESASQAAASRGNDSYKREQKKREEKSALYKAAAQKAIGLVAAKVEAVVGSPDGGAAAIKMLRHLAAHLTDCGGADACRMVSKRRNLDKVKEAHGRYDGTRAPVETLAHNLDSAKELLGLIAEVIAAHRAQSWCWSGYSGQMDAEEKAFWTTFGVDRVKLLVAAEDARREKAKPAKKAGGKKVKVKA